MARRCAGVPSSTPANARIRRTADEVARRTYELYERRGAIDGWDLDDWAEAEGELYRERATAPPQRG